MRKPIYPPVHALFLAALFVLAAHAHATPPAAPDYAELRAELDAAAAAHGASVDALDFDQNVALGTDLAIASSSCTATATVSIPGGIGVELSATAPTCEQAIAMLAEAIADLVSSGPAES